LVEAQEDKIGEVQVLEAPLVKPTCEALGLLLVFLLFLGPFLTLSVPTIICINHITLDLRLCLLRCGEMHQVAGMEKIGILKALDSSLDRRI
jgi:hypothetical protein